MTASRYYTQITKDKDARWKTSKMSPMIVPTYPGGVSRPRLRQKEPRQGPLNLPEPGDSGDQGAHCRQGKVLELPRERTPETEEISP